MTYKTTISRKDVETIWVTENRPTVMTRDGLIYVTYEDGRLLAIQPSSLIFLEIRPIEEMP